MRNRLFPTIALKLGGGVQASVPPPTDLIRDTFTDAAGTLLTAHVPEVGGPWSFLAGTFSVVAGNQCEPTSFVDGDVATIDATQADWTSTLDMTPRGAGVTAQFTGYVHRCTNLNNLWLAQLNPTSGNVELYDRQAGVFTLRGSAASGIVGGTTYAVEVVTTGNTHRVSVGGVLRITHVSGGFNNAATIVGIRLGRGAGAAAPRAVWDNLLVVP